MVHVDGENCSLIDVAPVPLITFSIRLIATHLISSSWQVPPAMSWMTVFGILAALFVLRCIYVLTTPLPVPGKARARPCNTIIVLGSGGHTTEMLHLLSNMSASQYSPRTYVVAGV